MLTRLFAGCLSRRAMARGGVGLAAGALAATGLAASTRAGATSQDAAIDAPAAGDGPTMLFLQAFLAGSFAPKEGSEGRYTLTLEQGLGYTVFFSDQH
ncbi:MAG TPA: hypothetical protein VH482_21710 [Thermomicrobiales bacterium]